MFEARLDQSDVLKKVLESIKELVTDANFDCSDEGIKLQAMDNSHVALVSLQLNAAAFSPYRCDRNMSLGMSLASLTKIVKCAQSDDTITLRADESHDVLGLLFESKKGKDRVGEYEMKLMDIDTEHLGIPDTVYDAEVSLPAAEFQRIIRDLQGLGESVKIEVSKDGVRFSAEGDIGSAAVTLKQTTGHQAADDDSDEEDDDDDEEEEEDEPKAEDSQEDKKPEVLEVGSDDEEPQVKAPKKKAAAEKKRKTSSSNDKKAAKKAKKEDNPAKVTINIQQAVSLTFSVKYLVNFAKSTPLSDYVNLHMSGEVPLLVEYPFGAGHIRYYLAPKIQDE